MTQADALLRYPLFALLGRGVIDLWVAAGRTASYATGDTVLEEGARGRSVCLLLSGRVRVSRRTDSGVEKSLGILAPGAVFGDYALLPPHLNTAGCRAAEPSAVLMLPIAPLRPAIDTRRTLRDNLKNWLRLNALVNEFRFGAGMGFVTGPSLAGLLESCLEIAARPAHAVQAHGLLGDGWLFVRAGEILLHSADGSAPRVLGPGDSTGERALVGKALDASAVALTESSCWFLPAEAFRMPFDRVVPVQTLRPDFRPSWQWLAQRGPTDCGVASLAMALRGHGVDVTIEEVAARTPLTDAGATLAALADSAAAFGRRPAAVRVGAEQLRYAGLPAVAHLQHGHYVTLFEAGQAGVVVGDPATGMRRPGHEEFRREWSGNLLLLAETARRA